MFVLNDIAAFDHIHISGLMSSQVEALMSGLDALARLKTPKPVAEALDMGYEQRGRPQDVLFYSDQSSQYGIRSFRERLWRYHFTKSMSRCGDCHHNAPMERRFCSLKAEWIPTVDYMSAALS